MKKPEEKLALVETALARLQREDACEGVNFSLEEREVVIAALEVAVEIIRAVLDLRAGKAA